VNRENFKIMEVRCFILSIYPWIDKSNLLKYIIKIKKCNECIQLKDDFLIGELYGKKLVVLLEWRQKNLQL